MIIKPKCYNYNRMLFTTLHRMLTNRNEVMMVILLPYAIHRCLVKWFTPPFMVKFLI